MEGWAFLNNSLTMRFKTIPFFALYWLALMISELVSWWSLQPWVPRYWSPGVWISAFRAGTHKKSGWLLLYHSPPMISSFLTALRTTHGSGLPKDALGCQNAKFDQCRKGNKWQIIHRPLLVFVWLQLKIGGHWLGQCDHFLQLLKH